MRKNLTSHFSHSFQMDDRSWSLCRVSIKSLYNLKNILQRQLMRYLNQICSMYSVVIKAFNHIVFVYFRYPVNERYIVKSTPKKWLLLKKRHNRCLLNYVVKIFNIYSLFCSNFYIFVFSFAFVINVLNWKKLGQDTWNIQMLWD